MKKLLIIAVASLFLFISCAKVEPTPATKTETASRPAPGSFSFDPATPQQYLITNTEKDWGVVPYTLTYVDVNNGEVQTVTLNMGQSITVCLASVTGLSANFSYSITRIGNC